MNLFESGERAPADRIDWLLLFHINSRPEEKVEATISRPAARLVFLKWLARSPGPVSRLVPQYYFF